MTECSAFILMLTAQLNQAARHRNVYYDIIGGDPYGEMRLAPNKAYVR